MTIPTKSMAKTLWQGANCKSESRIIIKLGDGRLQSYSVVVSTSVVPTENGGSIPPRTCGRDANKIRSDSEMVITSVFETGVRGSIPRRSIVLGMTL